MTKEENTNIVAFMTSRVGVVVLRYDHIADVMNMFNFIYHLSMQIAEKHVSL